MKPAAVLCEFNGNVAAKVDGGNIKKERKVQCGDRMEYSIITWLGIKATVIQIVEQLGPDLSANHLPFFFQDTLYGEISFKLEAR